MSRLNPKAVHILLSAHAPVLPNLDQNFLKCTTCKRPLDKCYPGRSVSSLLHDSDQEMASQALERFVFFGKISRSE